MKRFDPAEVFIIEAHERAYLRGLLFKEQQRCEPGTDDYRRAQGLWVKLSEEDS